MASDGGELGKVKLMTFQRISRIAIGAVLGACLAVPAVAQQRVSIYTAHNANIVERLVPEFEKATGIGADVVKAGSGDIINRARAEAANPKCDVIWSIGAELLEANTELLEPYQPKEAAMIADAFKSQEAEARGISQELGRFGAAAFQESRFHGRR